MSGWTVTFEDNFASGSLDTGKWTALNNDFMSYDLAYITSRSQNLHFADGYLYITALHESMGGRDYTTGYLHTTGKFAQKYGRWEMRAKLPLPEHASAGIWPAFWLRPNTGQPGDGEIDIMEAWGTPTSHDAEFDPAKRYSGTLWSDEVGGPNHHEWTADGLDLTTWHVYAMEWDPGEFRFYCDSTLFWTATAAVYPWINTAFEAEFAIRLNLQVGNNYWGPPDANTTWPAHMIVDYVRVLEKSVADASVSAKVIDAGNLVGDSTFEGNVTLGAPGWAGAGTPAPTVTLSTDQAHNGTHSLKVEASGAQSWFPMTNYTFNTEVGAIYNFTGWVYVPSGNPATQLMAPGTWGDAASQTNDQWEKVTLSNHVGTGAGDWIGVLIGNAPAVFYVDDVHVQRQMIPVPLVEQLSGPNYGGSVSEILDGDGSWVDPSNASGTDDNQYATWQTPVSSGIRRVHVTSGTLAAGTSHPITIPVTTAGNVLVVIVEAASNTTTITAAASGASFTEPVLQAAGTLPYSLGMLFSAALTGTTTTVTIGSSVSCVKSYTIIEYAGVLSGALEQDVATQFFAGVAETTVHSSQATTTFMGDVIIGAAGSAVNTGSSAFAATGPVPGGGSAGTWNNVANIDNNGGASSIGHVAADVIGGGAGLYWMEWGGLAASQVTGAIIALRSASARQDVHIYATCLQVATQIQCPPVCPVVTAGGGGGTPNSFTLSFSSDIHVSGGWNGSQAAWKNRVTALATDYVVISGDIASSGDAAAYNTYGANMSAFKSKTLCVPGNHDYSTGSANNWFAYFGSGTVGQGTAAAPWYSRVINGWHILMLVEAAGSPGSNSPSYASGSAQYNWVQADLIAKGNRPRIAVYHQPRWSDGTAHGDNSAGAAMMTLLANYGTDLILNGHDHVAQRFPPADGAGLRANGSVEMTACPEQSRSIGTGSAINRDWGQGATIILKVTCYSNRYEWQFSLTNSPYTVLDSGSRATHYVAVP